MSDAATEFLEIHYDDFADLFEEANQLFDKKKFDEALLSFAEALKIIPDPKEEWEETIAILTGIADVWYVKKNYQVCLDALNDALLCEGADEVAYVHFRKGQALYELDEIKEATESFYKAHILDEDLFENESDIYFDLLIAREK
ncbi:MAG: hypothetical protein NE334_20555 [Lentisphaeraceae bacterium]|nr:hypothetical protein [Lentisphaeraceae bacterium]